MRKLKAVNKSGKVPFFAMLSLLPKALVLTLFAITQSHTAIANDLKSCVAILEDAQGIKRLTFQKPESTQQWLELLDRIKHDTLFPDATFYRTILPSLNQLDEDTKQRLLTAATRNFRSLSKDPNRRLIELILNQLLRPDLRFKAYLKQGLSAEQAYAQVLKETQYLTGDEDIFDINDLRAITLTIQKSLRDDDSAFLVGSAPAGRGQIGRSDIDIEIESPKKTWQVWVLDRLPYRLRIRIYDQNINAIRNQVAQSLLMLRKNGFKTQIQVLDVTPGNIYPENTWLHQGVQNPFVLEIKRTKINLVVFSTPHLTAHDQLIYGNFERHSIFMD